MADNYLYPDMSMNRWVNVERRGYLANESQRSLQTEMLHTEPVNITIAGHSFVRRLNEYATYQFGSYHNMKIENSVANVTTIGISGLTIDKLLHQHMHRITTTNPQIVYIEIGSNDLCDPNGDIRQIGLKIKEACKMLLRLGIKKVIIGEIVFRFGRGIPRNVPDYNYKVLNLNRFLQVHLDSEAEPRLLFWRHKYVWRSALRLYIDGVHYNNDGNKRYFRSVRGALIKSIWSFLDDQ